MVKKLILASLLALAAGGLGAACSNDDGSQPDEGEGGSGANLGGLGGQATDGGSSSMGGKLPGDDQSPGAAGDTSTSDPEGEDPDGEAPDGEDPDTSPPDPGPTCAGTPAACESFESPRECNAQAGCVSGGRCIERRRPRDSVDCEQHATADSCESEGTSCQWVVPCQLDPDIDCEQYQSARSCLRASDACEWNERTETCGERIEGGCAEATTAFECRDRADCNWNGDNFACWGTASACGEFTGEACEAQSGCELR